MPAYTLRIRRYDPNSGEAAYWDEHTVEMSAKRSVLDAILKVKDDTDGSIGIRCSCQQAICGSCGVRMNGKPGLACNTHLEEAAARVHGVGWNPEGDSNGEATSEVITVEPMGNMPVIRDLIVDMDAVHWKKIQRVTPWLVNKEPVPEREYIVPHENMVDVTQTMACIQCGACVSDCLSMEVDPLFVGPAALAKAYRFVGDPRDADRRERLNDLGEDPHGIYDCTHCFNCIDACPKGVDPMSQIMRLRRRAGSDEHINDRNNGHRHEDTLVTLVRDYGLLHEAELLPRSYGGNSWFGKFHPNAGKVLLKSLPAMIPAILRGKVNIKIAALGHKIAKDDLDAVKQIYQEVGAHERRNELNLYVTGYEDDPEATRAQPEPAASAPEPEASAAERREPPAEPSAPETRAASAPEAPAPSAPEGESPSAPEGESTADDEEGEA
jgi:succinate dehydrogenase / fumarate reductase iron-sulfur subunit